MIVSHILTDILVMSLNNKMRCLFYILSSSLLATEEIFFMFELEVSCFNLEI